MPSITIPNFKRGAKGSRGESQSRPVPPPAPVYPDAWRGTGIPEPPLPPPNPMPVPRVPDLNYRGGQQYDNGDRTNWTPQQYGGGQGQQSSAWDMRNWFRPDMMAGGGQTNWMPQQRQGGQGKDYGFGGGQGGGMLSHGGRKDYGFGGGQGMNVGSTGGLFEALMRLFQ